MKAKHNALSCKCGERVVATMGGAYKGSSEKKINKSGDSLLIRLTARQVWRSIGYCVKLNLIIILIFIPMFFLYANSRAVSAMKLVNETGKREDITLIAERAFEFDKSISYYKQQGWVIRPESAVAYLGLPDGASFVFESSDWHTIQDLSYTVSYPAGNENEYFNIRVDLDRVIWLIKVAFKALLCFEAAMVLFGIFDIRRSTKKALRPIYDLTEAARMINNIHTPAPAALQELKLSGAIATLNTITEDHLDKRISIDDERAEIKGLASAINAMLDRLDAAYQAQLRFVSDASHELRTPISVIQGYANLLDRWGKKDEKALQESIDAIKSEAEGMESLVEQLLFLARSDNNTLKTDMRDLDVSALADEILRETEMIDGKHIVFGNITDGLYVHGDGQLLKQAIRVFMDNAIKYTPDGGRIRLSVARENNEVRMSVSDTGIGIAEKDIPLIFDRFFRADESRARKTGGTGLGLSIAKYIIDSHGGYIEIVSRQNIGTKIIAVLPEKIAVAVQRNEADNREDDKTETA